MTTFNHLPIAVIDSGIGGLSVLSSLAKNFPTENFIYYGDNFNSPYGNKPLDFIKERLFYVVDILTKIKVKGLVVACNTLSTHFYDKLKKVCPFFVVPTIPPIVRGEGVYLACTSNTAKSHYAKKFYGEKIISFPCLAKTIEDNVFNLDKFSVEPYFKKLNAKINLLVLGCTHYSFISKNIESQLGIKTVDGYGEIISLLRSELELSGVALEKKQTITFIGEAKNLNEKVYEKVVCATSGREHKKF